MSDRPPFVVRSSEVAEVEGCYPKPHDAEKLSLYRDLGRAAGSASIGASRERLPPGRRSSFTHAHLREEELVYVLAGRPTLRWIPSGGEPRECALAEGDLVAFPAGTGIAHVFRNDTADEVELFVVGERKAGERVVYPDDPSYAAWFEEQRPEAVWRDVAGPAGDARWPACRIETERLVLRPWEPVETGALLAAQRRNQDHLAPWMAWAATMPTVDELLARVRSWQAAFAVGDDLVYAIVTSDGRPIGGAGLHPRVGARATEIGYWIDRSHEGRGYVTEAVAALCRLALEVGGLERIEIHCDPRNERSAAVARRLGFRHEATLARRVPDSEGALRDTMVWTLFREEAGPEIGSRVVRGWDGAGRRLV